MEKCLLVLPYSYSIFIFLLSSRAFLRSTWSCSTLELNHGVVISYNLRMDTMIVFLNMINVFNI